MLGLFVMMTAQVFSVWPIFATIDDAVFPALYVLAFNSAVAAQAIITRLAKTTSKDRIVVALTTFHWTIPLSSCLPDTHFAIGHSGCQTQKNSPETSGLSVGNYLLLLIKPRALQNIAASR
jgi:uncharacterized membrane protein